MSRRRPSRAGMLVFVAAMLVLALGRPARGEQPEEGRQLYLKYCSACHGSTGKGDGVVSGLMTPRPADLTTLAKRAGGKFPFQEVMHVIDGRHTYRAHGDPDMPVWGDVFREESPGSAPEKEQAARGKVALITDYLNTIQVWQ